MANERERVATAEEMAEEAVASATDATRFTKVEVEVDGTPYVLEFNRATVKRMEAQGFDVSDMGAKPLTTIEELVVGAFEMHHPSLSRSARLMVWGQLGGKSGTDGLIAALTQLYVAPVNSLVADPTTTTATWKMA